MKHVRLIANALSLLFFTANSQVVFAQQESVLGWQAARWGMKRAEIKAKFPAASYIGQRDCLNMEGGQLMRNHIRRFDCPGASLDTSISGMEWYVRFFFDQGEGLHKVELRPFDNPTNVDDLYSQLKQQLSEKYGKGSESSRIEETCDEAMDAYRNGGVQNFRWKRFFVTELIITTAHGITNLEKTTVGLCGQTPAAAAARLRGVLQQNLSVTYLKRTRIDSSKF